MYRNRISRINQRIIQFNSLIHEYDSLFIFTNPPYFIFQLNPIENIVYLNRYLETQYKYGTLKKNIVKDFNQNYNSHHLCHQFHAAATTSVNPEEIPTKSAFPVIAVAKQDSMPTKLAYAYRVRKTVILFLRVKS